MLQPVTLNPSLPHLLFNYLWIALCCAVPYFFQCCKWKYCASAVISRIQVFPKKSFSFVFPSDLQIKSYLLNSFVLTGTDRKSTLCSLSDGRKNIFCRISVDDSGLRHRNWHDSGHWDKGRKSWRCEIGGNMPSSLPGTARGIIWKYSGPQFCSEET